MWNEMEKVKELGGFIVMPSVKSYEQLKFDHTNWRDGFQLSKINGIEVIYIEGGKQTLKEKLWGIKNMP